jgi:hypothetical protein
MFNRYAPDKKNCHNKAVNSIAFAFFRLLSFFPQFFTPFFQAQIESDEIHFERIGESTLVLFVEVDNFDPDAVSAKWYKDGKLVEDCSDTEYHTGDSNNVSAQSSNSVVAISLYVANYQAAEGQWSLTIDDGVASQTIGLNLTGEKFAEL